jgi:hypothetical protein
MEEWTDAVHPSVWDEQFADQIEAWRQLAAIPTHDLPRQLELFNDDC